MNRKELQSLLDAHGADPARWPPAVRTAAMHLIGRDTEAARIFQEAQALDRLLAVDAPPPAPLPAEELARTIIARADASGRADRATGHRGFQAAVIPFPPEPENEGKSRKVSNAVSQEAVLSPLPPAANDEGPGRWMAAGVLAASLALGVLLGGILSASPMGEQLLEPVRMALADEGLGEIVRLASPADGGELP